ncbi:MAG: nucleoside-triphosphatase [Clostridiales Family XIII bacterium]|jgi:nucleoside-triphosphatase THEP1|nr:nucleoside-triphosphatase [Clostridiales Family XIII bacterium]
MPANWFLTGLPGAGKSTIISGLAARLGCGVGGFKTVSGPEGPPGVFRVYIMPYGADGADLSGLDPVAMRDRAAGGFRAFPEVFDREGAAMLRVPAGGRLTVMDELGFMEADALRFQEAVFAALDGEIPVLGAIKPAGGRTDAPFLREIRARGDVRIFEVSPGGRGAAKAALERELARLMGL